MNEKKTTKVLEKVRDLFTVWPDQMTSGKADGPTMRQEMKKVVEDIDELIGEKVSKEDRAFSLITKAMENQAAAYERQTELFSKILESVALAKPGRPHAANGA